MVKELVKDEVKGQLNKILPKKIANFATPMIERNVVDSYERVDLFDTYGEAYSLKRDRDDKDKDEDPSVGSDQGKKRRKSRKEAEPSQEPKSRSSKSTSSSKGPT
ncbi:hypothetical protein Tco_0011808 [Tanacetum coccineum]